jgi:hypothetical protein
LTHLAGGHGSATSLAAVAAAAVAALAAACLAALGGLAVLHQVRLVLLAWAVSTASRVAAEPGLH